MTGREGNVYEIGLGKVDITGPCVGLRFFGYANLAQVGAGLEQRLFARAFIVRWAEQTIVFVNCDVGMISELIRARVTARVQEHFGARYPADCLCFSANHSHSTPGGYSAYLLYNLSIMGHSQRMIDTLTDGIFAAIQQADGCLQRGYVSLAVGSLTTASTNRTSVPYQHNPEATWSTHRYPFNERMVQLCFWSEHGALRGLLNWFAVHCTSYDKHNRLVSGDNKGYASWFAEQHLNRGCIAAFAQSNSGDVSPNRRETPDNRLEGEGETGRESVRIIGERQARKAIALVQGEQVSLRGPLHSRLLYVDFATCEVPAEYSSTARMERVGPAVLGRNFITGSKDGRGPTWFDEGTQEHGLLVALIARMTSSPLLSEEELNRHAPKLPFLRLSRARTRWVPSILPLQLLTIGSVAVVALPFEVSTIAGFRICHWLQGVLAPIGVSEVVIASLSNAYAGYLTTPEEYDQQYYEAASTLFGREQLSAVHYHLERLARSISNGVPAPAGAAPPRVGAMKIFGPNLDKQPIDAIPATIWYGDVVEDCKAQYQPGETAQVIFWSAHLVHHPHGVSYFDVQRKVGNQWQVVADDHDWSTQLHWESYFSLFARCTCRWEIPSQCPVGTYRLVHHGTRRSRSGQLQSYQGVSRTFEVNRIIPFLEEAITPDALPIFAGVAPEAVATAQQLFEIIIVAPGTTVVEQGTEEHSILYVLRGKLAVWMDDVELSRIGPGESVGELAFFNQRPRSATVKALDASELMRLSWAESRVLWYDANEVAYQIERHTLRLLASRLRHTDFIISQMAAGVRSPYRKPSLSLLQQLRAFFASDTTPSVSVPPADVDPLEVLRQVALFAAIPEHELRVIATWFEPVTAGQGEFLCTQGEPGDTLYVLGAGTVDVAVSIEAAGEERIEVLARLGVGETFGLTALVDNRPRGASCVACEPVTLLALQRSQWLVCLEQSTRPASALRCAMIRAFSEQLVKAGQHILSLDEAGQPSLMHLARESARMELGRDLETDSA